MLSFDVKIAKIGPVDLEIICLREIIKKYDIYKKRKKRRVKYIALPASLPSGLNKSTVVTEKGYSQS